MIRSEYAQLEIHVFVFDLTLFYYEFDHIVIQQAKCSKIDEYIIINDYSIILSSLKCINMSVIYAVLLF